MSGDVAGGRGSRLRLAAEGFLLTFPMDWHLRRHHHHAKKADRHEHLAHQHRVKTLALADRGMEIMERQAKS